MGPEPGRRLACVLLIACGGMLAVDAGWAVLSRMFGWYHGHAIIYLSLGMYTAAGFFGYECGGRLLAALAGAVVCIVDNALGTYITWLILPEPVARTLPSIADLAPMFAESVVLALGLGFTGGLVAAARRQWRERRRELA